MDLCILELNVCSLHLTRVAKVPGGGVVVLRRAVEPVALDVPNAWTHVARSFARLLRAAHARNSDTQPVVIASPRFRGVPGADTFLAWAAGRHALTLWSPAAADRALLVATGASTERRWKAGIAALDLGDDEIGAAATRGGARAAASARLGLHSLQEALERGPEDLQPEDGLIVQMLVKLCAGPALRRIAALSPGSLLLSFEEARGLRALSTQWGYLDDGEDAVPRIAFRALAAEISAMGSRAGAELGLERDLCTRLPIAAAVTDAVAGLLGVQSVVLAHQDLAEGAALGILEERSRADTDVQRGCHGEGTVA